MKQDRSTRATYDGRKITTACGRHTATTFRAAGSLVAHKTLGRTFGWSLSLPCGASLGQSYASRAVALVAAERMAPLVKDWNGATITDVFGDEAAARRAYDLAEAARKQGVKAEPRRTRFGLGF